MSDKAPDTTTKFGRAVTIVNGLPKEGPVKLTRDELLTFYKYYKQACVTADSKKFEDVPQPDRWKFTERAKWEAWAEVKNMDPDDAKEAYVAKLLGVLERVDTEEAKGWIAWIAELD